MDATSHLDIDLDSIHHNVSLLRGLCRPEVRFCGVLKADGYGLGARQVAPTLIQAGASMLAVFSPDEAEPLLDLEVPILILMPVGHGTPSPTMVMAMQAARVQFVVHQAGQMAALERLARSISATLQVHLKIDTGLHRGGCDPRDAIVMIRSIQRSAHLRLAGIMTHFAEAATSESVTATQMKRLQAVLDSARGELDGDVVVHASGTCGLLRHPAYHADLVRVGLGWTGHLTAGDAELTEALPCPLRPAVDWTSYLALVREVSEGSRVGYGGKWIAPRASRIGLIPVGYADGYPHDGATPLDGGSGLSVGVGGTRGVTLATAPVIGAVNMDQIAIDLTEIDERVEVGDPVRLISSRPGSPVGLEHMAARLGRSCHTLLVQIQAHVPRRYAQVEIEARSAQKNPPSACSVAG